MATFTQGHVCIPSDNAGAHNGALLNTSTGLIDANFTTVACEDWGGILPATSFALAQSSNAVIYDFSFNLLHTVACGAAVDGLTSDYGLHYYATTGTTPATTKQITGSSGAIGTTRMLTIAGSKISGTAFSPTGIIYYGVESDPAAGSIKRFDFTGNMALSDLVTGAFPNGTNESWICLPAGDRIGDLIVAYTADNSVTYPTWFLNRYAPTGILQLSIPLPVPSDAGGSVGITLSTDPFYPNTFWARIFPSMVDTTTRILQYSLNGSILQSFDLTTSADPNSIAPSCPLFGWSQALVPPPPGPPFGPGDNVPATVGTRQTVPVKWVRRTSQMSNELLWQFFSEFQVMFQPGVGNANDPGKYPSIGLRWSNDGGNTWSNQRWVSAGAQGRYDTRAIWRMLGRGRNRVWELTSTDPVVWAIVDAFATVEMQS